MVKNTKLWKKILEIFKWGITKGTLKNLPACKTTFISDILNNKETSLCYSWWFWAQTTEPSRFQLENKFCPLPWAPAVMHSQPQWNCSTLSFRRQFCVYGCETIPGFAERLGLFLWFERKIKSGMFLYQTSESLLPLLTLHMSNETITDISI